jgi:hypothetical protein
MKREAFILYGELAGRLAFAIFRDIPAHVFPIAGLSITCPDDMYKRLIGIG